MGQSSLKDKPIEYWGDGTGRKWGGVYINDLELKDGNRAATLISIHELLSREGLKNVRSRYDTGRHQHLIYGEVLAKG